MNELEFERVEDGKLVAVDPAGTPYTLPITPALRAAVRETPSPDLPEVVVQVPEVLRPKDIQSLVRAGARPEELARVSNLDPAHIDRYAAPVMDERAYIAARARALTLPNEPGSPTLEALAAERLAQRGVDADTLEWDAVRQPSGWVVRLNFTASEGPSRARWQVDLAAGSLTPLEEQARWITRPTEPDSPIPPARHLSPVPSDDELDYPDPADSPYSLLDDLMDARGLRDPLPPGMAADTLAGEADVLELRRADEAATSAVSYLDPEPRDTAGNPITFLQDLDEPDPGPLPEPALPPEPLPDALRDALPDALPEPLPQPLGGPEAGGAFGFGPGARDADSAYVGDAAPGAAATAFLSEPLPEPLAGTAFVSDPVPEPVAGSAFVSQAAAEPAAGTALDSEPAAGTTFISEPPAQSAPEPVAGRALISEPAAGTAFISERGPEPAAGRRFISEPPAQSAPEPGAGTEPAYPSLWNAVPRPVDPAQAPAADLEPLDEPGTDPEPAREQPSIWSRPVPSASQQQGQLFDAAPVEQSDYAVRPVPRVVAPPPLGAPFAPVPAPTQASGPDIPAVTEPDSPPPAPPTPPRSRSAAKRSSVPSWDEIVFGAARTDT
ncbi:MAG: DUF3071 domain-containing protein [Bifidobacteriaceae bacterium]|jgi:hypothetical protein|nr:DUF3071 domain-containing protein [Bifidobacteriaceae bacterium]